MVLIMSVAGIAGMSSEDFVSLDRVLRGDNSEYKVDGCAVIELHLNSHA